MITLVTHDGRIWKFEDGVHFGFRSQDEEGEFICIRCDNRGTGEFMKKVAWSELSQVFEQAWKYTTLYD